MVSLRCGCFVTEEGVFVVGDNCKNNGCIECNLISKLHPFGNGRFRDDEVKKDLGI